MPPQVSITFDPFLYLPVPLPQKQKVLPVFFFAREPHSKPIKVRRRLLFRAAPGPGQRPTDSALSPQFLVSVSKENSSASEVLDALSQRVHVPPENLRLTEVRPSFPALSGGHVCAHSAQTLDSQWPLDTDVKCVSRGCLGTGGGAG